MSERYEPRKQLDIVYASRDFITGLTDVLVSIYRADGSPIAIDQVMTEIGTTGMYKYTTTLNTAETYVAKADSATRSKADSFTLYMGGKPGDFKMSGGGVMQKHLPSIWTQQEKEKLIEMVSVMAKQIDQIQAEKDALTEMVDIQRKILLAYERAVGMYDATKSESMDHLNKVAEEIKALGQLINQNPNEDTLKVIKSKLEQIEANSNLMITALPDEVLDRADPGDDNDEQHS